MSALFSLVYPTRHRPQFVEHALRVLEIQEYDNFEVVISDNYEDPGLSALESCRSSSLTNLQYVRPPRPLGMVENWNYALQFASGQYVCFLTDKMFVLPNALRRIDLAIASAGRPEIISWTGDEYHPESYADYFGPGRYWPKAPTFDPDPFRQFEPATELTRRGVAQKSRGEQSPAEYCRGKIVFGAYGRQLIDRIVARFGALFFNISPDYTSMVLALSEAEGAIELSRSCVASLNTDISNGALSDSSDEAALRFLDSLEGGSATILPNLLVPRLYASQHNVVAHDFLTLKSAFDLPFEFSPTNWLVYCTEDIYRPGRLWSDATIEGAQKLLLRAFVESLGHDTARAIDTRVRSRSRSRRVRQLLGEAWRTVLHLPPRTAHGDHAAPSLESALAHQASVMVNGFAL